MILAQVGLRDSYEEKLIRQSGNNSRQAPVHLTHQLVPTNTTKVIIKVRFIYYSAIQHIVREDERETNKSKGTGVRGTAAYMCLHQSLC